MKKLVVIVALLVSASLAFAGQTATVTVTRAGFQLTGLMIYVDGKPAFKLANGESKTFTITLGDHFLGVWKWGGSTALAMPQIERDFSARAGQHYSFRLRFSVGDGWFWQRFGAGGDQ
jgi:hypothetical protein